MGKKHSTKHIDPEPERQPEPRPPREDAIKERDAGTLLSPPPPVDPKPPPLQEPPPPPPTEEPNSGDE